MSAPIVVGLDLSLTSTGWARQQLDETARLVSLFMPGKRRGCDRLIWLRKAVTDICRDADLILIEDGVVRSQAAKALGELHGVVKVALHELERRVVLVPPASVKKYATGKGNAGKPDMLAAAIRRLDYQRASDDEADALWLCAMGLDHLGAPPAQLPAAQREALGKVAW